MFLILFLIKFFCCCSLAILWSSPRYCFCWRIGNFFLFSSWWKFSCRKRIFRSCSPARLVGRFPWFVCSSYDRRAPKPPSGRQVCPTTTVTRWWRLQIQQKTTRTIWLNDDIDVDRRISFDLANITEVEPSNPTSSSSSKFTSMYDFGNFDDPYKCREIRVPVVTTLGSISSVSGPSRSLSLSEHLSTSFVWLNPATEDKWEGDYDGIEGDGTEKSDQS